MRRLLIFASSLLITSLALAADKPAATIQLPPKPLLPQSFAGWTAVSGPVEVTQAQQAFKQDEVFLKELGFRRAARATYRQGDCTLEVTADEFEDATGAYGEFAGDGEPAIVITPLPVMFPDKSQPFDVKLRSGDTTVFTWISGPLPAHFKDDLRALTKALPIPTGRKAQIPPLAQYLPKQGLDIASVQYALGPSGMKQIMSPLADKLDFNTGAEVIVAKYGSDTLTLVEYPTPQMAAAQLKSFATSLQLAPQKNLPEGLLGGADMVAWRTGPLVGLTSGMSQPAAIKLAKEVHYESQLTWNHPEGYVSDAWRAAHLYVGIFALAGILCAASVFLGLFFGGARAIMRVLRGKSASAVQDEEFISLDLGSGGDLKRLGSQRQSPPQE